MIDTILLAQAPAGEGGAPLLWQFAPFIALAFVFYFLMIRPMRKQEQDRKAMVSSLKKNARVITSAGIIGNILRIKDDDEIVLLKLDEGKISILKSSIVRALPDEENKASSESEA
jgi:preprotein translocase subunit YajC